VITLVPEHRARSPHRGRAFGNRAVWTAEPQQFSDRAAGSAT